MSHSKIQVWPLHEGFARQPEKYKFGPIATGCNPGGQRPEANWITAR
jgi:hypothetical protein